MVEEFTGGKHRSVRHEDHPDGDSKTSQNNAIDITRRLVYLFTKK